MQRRMLPTRSPIQRRDLGAAKKPAPDSVDLGQFLSMAQEVLKARDEMRTMLTQLPQISKGERGPQGLPGMGRDGRPGRDGKDGRDGANGKDGRPGLNGRDGRSVSPEEVLTLLKKTKLKTEDVEGLQQTLSALDHQTKRGYLHGGGVPSLTAGVNITLTPKQDGGYIISAAGGTSGSNTITQYSLTAVQAGSDVTIDLTQLTHWATFVGLVQVIRNNVPQTQNIDFTFSSPTVTVKNADASEVFSIMYAYTS